MAKNLYYFVCKKYSRFNPESDFHPNPAEEDIRLIPVGFVNNNWKCDTTTDPDFFWAQAIRWATLRHAYIGTAN